MKKIIIFVLALALCMALAVIPAFAATVDAEYLDANGSKQTAADVTKITGGCEKGAGWYILSGSLSLGKLTFNGDTHLILADGADITVSGGILLNGKNASLTIYGQSAGTGKLTVKDVPKYFAGIGCGDAMLQESSCGNITINGGIITATGGEYGTAGIGSGAKGTCVDITINGGMVTAYSGTNRAAGIGSGQYGHCGNITINGGIVIATGTEGAADIGAGYVGSCGNITISGGIVIATGDRGAADIGAAYGGRCGIVTVTPDNYDNHKQDGKRCINCDYIPAVATPSCLEFSHSAFYRDRMKGAEGSYYSALPFTEETYIGSTRDEAANAVKTAAVL